jgi:hypothetical protein
MSGISAGPAGLHPRRSRVSALDVGLSNATKAGQRFDPSPTKAEKPFARAMPISVVTKPAFSPSPCTDGALRALDQEESRRSVNEASRRLPDDYASSASACTGHSRCPPAKRAPPWFSASRLRQSALTPADGDEDHEGMAGRVDLDLYGVLLGFGWARERGEPIKATIDPRFLSRARRALFPLPIVDRPKVVDASTESRKVATCGARKTPPARQGATERG